MSISVVKVCLVFVAFMSGCQPSRVPRSDAQPENADVRAVEAQTITLLEAVRRKDLDAIEALKIPEFEWVLSKDHILDRTQARAFQARSFELFRDFSEFQYSIGPPRIDGDTAVAIVLIRAVFRYQAPSGDSYVLAQTASHEDTWVRRGDRWQFARDRVLEAGYTRDGLRYDPLADPEWTGR